jgi:hypothetical protein
MIFLQECEDFTWRMTDYEELVGVQFLNGFVTNYFTQNFHLVFLIDSKFVHTH